MRKIIGITGAALAAVAIAFAAPSAHAAMARPVVYGHACIVSWCDPDVRPHGTERFIFGAGGRQYITRMSWGHWNNTNAGGSGTIHICSSQTGCTPHHVSMLLYQVRSHNGHKYYRKLTLRWTHHVQRVTYARHGGTAVYWG